jgi:hypothetical protein
MLGSDLAVLAAERENHAKNCMHYSYHLKAVLKTRVPAGRLRASLEQGKAAHKCPVEATDRVTHYLLMHMKDETNDSAVDLSPAWYDSFRVNLIDALYTMCVNDDISFRRAGRASQGSSLT